MAPNSRVRVHSFAVSADGYGAGPEQSLDRPMGAGGMALHEWAFGTRSLRQLLGLPGADECSTGIDDGFIARGFQGIGATVMGRNMFGPVRGPWRDESWRGWWGEEPPFHHPVYVLTHHPRASITMQGGTVFHFVTDGLEAALARARAAAGGLDVRLGGGVATVRQALQRRLVDEMHLAMTPALLGRGEALLAGIDLPALGYRCTRHVCGELALHLVIERVDARPGGSS